MKNVKNNALFIMLLFMIQGCAQKEFALPDAGSVDFRHKLSGDKLMSTRLPPPPQGQIYFQQDFNSSTDINDYVMNPSPGPNQFDAAAVVGNNTVNTLNNKFQYNKYAGAGNNRGGFTKLAIEDGPAQFLRFSMEVTISRNNSTQTNGFQLSIVDANTNTSPATPPNNTGVHSAMHFNTTTEDGTFMIYMNGRSSAVSQPLSGTQHLLWYVNNMDGPVGYNAPDGSIASLEENHSDVWIMTETSAMRIIQGSDKLSAGKLDLIGFKLSANDSFDATMEIDDIVLSEEPVVIVPNIVAVASVAPVYADIPIKVSLDRLPLPTEIEVTYDDGTKGMAKVTWAGGAGGYNMYNYGTYNVVGTIIPNRGTANPQGLDVATIVVVERSDLNIVNAFTPNNDGVNDTWIIPELSYYRNISIEVFDRNGARLFHTTDPKQGWDGKNQYGKVVAGTYNYIINVPVLGPEKRGVVTVIK